jgi:hypothetical protein
MHLAELMASNSYYSSTPSVPFIIKIRYKIIKNREKPIIV